MVWELRVSVQMNKNSIWSLNKVVLMFINDLEHVFYYIMLSVCVTRI